MQCTLFYKIRIYSMCFLSCEKEKRFLLLVRGQNIFKTTAVRLPECTVQGFGKEE